MIMLLWLVCFQ